uniref:Nuclear inhibitor of protein phosphatase 1 n=1 Tax=Glossina austeni TaxID=7395 RepID=A0A1A9UHD1_GLOAU
MANNYEIPSWAGKPPTGLHLDVLKEDKLVQKLMVDEKKCYLFGRNAQMNDFCIDHASCSRVHAAFVYHKHLNIAYLVDLGSTHGTFIGTLRIEPNKPTQLHVNSTFHFGASTRRYILRERPSAGQRSNIMEDIPMNDANEGALLGLPESQTELDTKSRKRRCVTFNDEEIIINPEDIDPNVGRFRNLVQTTVIPIKRARYEGLQMGLATPTQHITLTSHQMFQQGMQDHIKNLQNAISSTSTTSASPSLYQGLPAATHDGHIQHVGNDFTLASPLALGSKLGLLLPNPAPDVTPVEASSVSPMNTPALTRKLASANVRYDGSIHTETNDEPQKKKYAKEAWPGRKPMLGTL